MKKIGFSILCLLILSTVSAQDIETSTQTGEIETGVVLTGTINTGNTWEKKCYKEASTVITKEFKEKRQQYHNQKAEIKKEIILLMGEKHTIKNGLKRSEMSTEIQKLNEDIWKLNINIALSFKDEYETKYFAKRAEPKGCK